MPEELPFELDERLADQLEALDQRTWEGLVWRHMFGAIPPHTSNTRGARWNPPQIAAVYTSLDRPTVLAEAEHAMSVQPVRPTTGRKLYQLQIRLSAVVDLTDRTVLRTMGLSESAMGEMMFAATQQIGGTVAWLGRDGMLVPSARHSGSNLVIFTANRDEEAVFDQVAVEEL